MLVITIELWPQGDASRKEVLGVAEIANDGRGSAGLGSYNVTLYKWGKEKRFWKTGRVLDFPRLKLGPWDLLYRALSAVVGLRNKEVSHG